MFSGGSGRRPPAHAGRLTRWERLAFVAIFLLMIAYIVVVTISALRSHASDRPRGDGSRPIAARTYQPAS